MHRKTGQSVAALMFVLALAVSTFAHDAPVQLPPPQSPGEAWNVIEQSKDNIDLLISENLMRDVGAQLANISTALRALPALSTADHHAAEINELAALLIIGEVDLLRASRDSTNPQAKTSAAFGDWCESLAKLEALYPAEVVHAEVYICPMHPFDRHLNPNDKCSICGMALVRRHLPASGIYQKPGQPTMKLTITSPQLVVGQPVAVIMHLAKSDGSPVRFEDLIEVHTKKIHLLINDRSLSDYHHVHPTPTTMPGDYAFTFTPLRPGPYRVWADVVPSDSGIQAYDIADLPADTAAGPITDRQTRTSTVVDGRTFALKFQTGDAPLPAGQTVIGTITITGADGKGFTGLEPVMGAFAHLVGFSEDGKSVLHIHPYGRDPTGPADRAGPAFAFKFYAPAAGFLRLYCQVQIGGANVFAPFNLNIAPPATQPSAPQ